jgi:hypothetical protein
LTSRILGRLAWATALTLVVLSAVPGAANAAPAASSIWSVRPHSVSSKCAEIPHSTLNTVQVDIYTCLDPLPDNERWSFEQQGTFEGYPSYRLRNIATNKCMNIPGSSLPVSGDLVFQNTCLGTTGYSDQWIAYPFTLGGGDGDWYQLRSRNNDSLCLNVYKNSTANAAGLIVYNCTSALNSQWTWIAA